MTTKTIHIDTIGPVRVTRRKGSSRLSMRVKPDGTVSVNCPWFATNKEVIDFVGKNQQWIKTQQEKRQEQVHFYAPGDVITTKHHQIQLVSSVNDKLQAGIKDGKAVLTIPENVDHREEGIQLFVRKIIAEVCRKEAKLYLPLRVKELADKHHFSFSGVSIKNLKSKWGSCSSAKNINMNVQLMRLPDELIDYIILHELAHTRHMNHGEGFWALLNEITGGKARALDQEIKKQGKLIFR
ncbi:MAG: M48 family metallopeptidase [Prolixibacteraceae bacterium]|nr:M48 family metallopeptidase [Prolixibacteraceae bacterium]